MMASWWFPIWILEAATFCWEMDEFTRIKMEFIVLPHNWLRLIKAYCTVGILFLFTFYVGTLCEQYKKLVSSGTYLNCFIYSPQCC